MKNIKIILIAALSSILCACSALNSFFDKDNTPNPSPLVSFNPEIQIRSLWQTKANLGAGKEYIKLVPAISGDTLYTASYDGTLTATNKFSGKKCWAINTMIPITGGPATGENLIVVGSREGDVLALTQDGARIWKVKLSSEVLAPPAISQGVVLVKTIDGKLVALSSQDGHELWQFEQTEPLLILRGSSAPQIKNNNVVAGFANGSLAQLTLREGNLHWVHPIATPYGAFAIQRMIDIDADPIILNNRIYAATYQGRITALQLYSGQSIWTHDISSYTGIAADCDTVYVSDATSTVWAFNAKNGEVRWRQTELAFRQITGPVIMGNYIVVGDSEGYLHWLSKMDGHFVGRTRITKAAILATPIVENDILYVLTQYGHLAAYTLVC